MISVQDVQGCYTIYVLSTDTKPTKNVPNGCMAIEIDTTKCYFWDAENQRWIVAA